MFLMKPEHVPLGGVSCLSCNFTPVCLLHQQIAGSSGECFVTDTAP